MKTNFKKSAIQSIFYRLVLIILIGSAITNVMNGQAIQVKSHDYLLPKKGKSMVEFYTGSPYVAIGQYTYGISNRFAVGAIYGYTPFVKAFGLRVKSVVAQPNEDFRIILKSPFLYYPHFDPHDDEPWVAAWPTLNFEWKLKNEARIWAGIGILGAACTDFLFGDEKMMPGKEEDEVMVGVYNTFQLGYSKPLSSNLSFVLEVAPVMEGFKLKSKDGFLDLIPVVVTTGLSYSF